MTSVGVMASGVNLSAGPPSIPTTGMIAWFDAADASTFTFGTGAAVAQWSSRAPATAVGVQTDATFRPSRNGTLNGNPVLTFTAHAFHGNPWVNGTPTESLFIVFVPRTLGPGSRYILGCTRVQGTGGHPRWVYMTAAGKVVFRYGNDSQTSLASVTLNQPTVFEVVRNVTTNGVVGPMRFYFNGVLDLDSSSNFGLTNNGIEDMGGQYYDNPNFSNEGFQGDIAEVIDYNWALSDTERQQVESYLKAKWGTP